MKRAYLLLWIAIAGLSLVAQQPSNQPAPAQKKDQPAAAGQPASADVPSKEQVLKLFDLLQIRRNMQMMMQGMKQGAKQGADQALRRRVADPTPEQIEKMNRIADEMFSDFPLDELLDVIVPVYQRHMTKSDIDAITAFYSSPVGQKMLREQPQMMQEAMQAARSVSEKVMAAKMDKIDKAAEAMFESDKAKPAPKKQ